MTSHITMRQDQVLRLVAVGCTNQEIADHCRISITTVQRHVEDIRTALDARNRAHAVYVAMQIGILDPAAVAS